jgi:hypothetical protein
MIKRAVQDLYNGSLWDHNPYIPGFPLCNSLGRTLETEKSPFFIRNFFLHPVRSVERTLL